MISKQWSAKNSGSIPGWLLISGTPIFLQHKSLVWSGICVPKRACHCTCSQAKSRKKDVELRNRSGNLWPNAGLGRDADDTSDPISRFLGSNTDETPSPTPSTGLTETETPRSSKRTQRAQDSQVGGDHYVARSVQPWDIWAAYFHDMDPFTATVIKYMLRWQDKNGLQDLEKAAHTLQKLIELVKERSDIEG